MAMDPENVSTTVLDLINQLRGQNFSPDLAEQAVQSREYGSIPATYKPQQPLPPESPTAGRDFGATFWDKLYRNLEGSGQAMREGARGMTVPGEKRALAPLQALLGVLGGAFAIPGAATEHFIAEPVSQAIGGKAGAFAGGVAEQLPYLGLGALGKAAGTAGKATGAKIPRAMPGKRTGTDWDPRTGKGSFVGETMERRGPGRMTDEDWARGRREAPTYETPNPQGQAQSFRDPISHRQTEMDPGYFGPLIENYYKSLTREGIGPSISGGAPARPAAPPAPRVSELSRPWVGVKPAVGPQGGPLNVPKSYKKPKTYDLSEYE